MTKEQFGLFLRDLCVYFCKEIPKDRILSEYAKCLSPVPNEKCDSFYSYLVRHFKFFPKITELEDAARLFIPEPVKKVVVNSELCFCCMNSGLIPYNRKIPELSNREYVYYAACPNCAVGNSRRELPNYNSIFPDGRGLAELKKENEKRFGHITKPQAEQAKQQVLSFLRQEDGPLSFEKST